GTVKAGAVLVTINFRLALPEIEYVLNDSETRVLFVGREYAEQIDQIRSQLPKLQKVIVIDESDTGEYYQWRDAQKESAIGQNVLPEDGAVQMYTSGTTGRPKGVELSHYAMVAAADAGLGVWPFLQEPGAAVLGTMPLFHIAAANLCIAALYAGARAEILRETSPPELVQVIIERGISLVPVPAAVIHAILRMPGVRDYDFSALKTMLIAGSGISVELLKEAQQVFGCGFALSYGSTETCGGMTYLGAEECTHDAGKLLASAGTVLGDAEIKIVDEQGNEVNALTTGEILCKSKRLMTGYWKLPDATADALEGDWYRSGDAGYVDSDGYLYVVDRIKDMVVTGGENVYPAEIEKHLREHATVDDVAIIGIPDQKWGEALMAFVIPRPDTKPTADELETFLRPRIAGYKIPRKYEIVSDFPRNATGKVLKRSLRAPFLASKDNKEVS
ncbi:MAG: AMP-binding protein, partial [Pseudomonadales bacterium]